MKTPKIPFLKKRFGKIKKKASSLYPSGFNTYYLGDRTPIWVNTQNLNDYANIVSTNPVVYSVLNLRANFFSNGRVNLKDLKTGEIITRENIYEANYRNNKVVKKAFELFNKPNPLQSKWEFLQAYLYFKDTFGNAFLYGNTGTGVKMDLMNVNAIWNLWPQWMNVILTGKYLSATNLNEIISEWRFGYTNEKEYTFLPENILHRKEVNVKLATREDVVFGMSKLKPLKRPISNISMSYESENVILQERGARMVITPKDKRDEVTGLEPLDDKEKEKLDEDFSEYGFLEGQKPYIISRIPVDVNTIDQDIRKLGIFESIATDTMIVCNAYGVPEILVKLYLTGATFENQSASVKRMYDGTTIPEFNDFVDDFTDWVNLREYGYEYVSDFSHVPELQEDLQKKAVANRATSTMYKELFFSGGCTYNQWKRAIGQPEVDGWGDLRITELSFRDQTIVMGTPAKSEDEEAADPTPEVNNEEEEIIDEE